MPEPLTHPSEREWYVQSVKLGYSNANMGWRRRLEQYQRLRLVALVTALAVPVVSLTPAPKWVLTILGSIVALIEGYFQIAKPQEQIIIRMRLATQMASELRAYEAKAGEYRDKNDDDRFQAFFDRIESLRKQSEEQTSALLQGQTETKTATAGPPGAE